MNDRMSIEEAEELRDKWPDGSDVHRLACEVIALHGERARAHKTAMTLYRYTACGVPHDDINNAWKHIEEMKRAGGA